MMVFVLRNLFRECRGKKSDVLHFGMLVMSVLIGDFIDDEIYDPPVTLPQEAKDFISRCVSRYDKDRWTVDQLLAHRFITTKPLIADKLHALIPSESEKSMNCCALSSVPDGIFDWLIAGFYKDLRGNLPDEGHSDLASQLATRSLALPNESRLHREFEILQFCGRGGYGDVLKVRNVLDGRNYAIKRIPLNETRERLNKRILREVQLLSRLNHENVVR